MWYSGRLIFDKPVKEDFQRFYEIHADPQTNLFNPKGAMNFETAEKVFDYLLEHWETKGFGTWSIREKELPEFIIGFGGLSERLYGDEIKLNLGYRFDKNYWGKGYATELSEAAIIFGFVELEKKEIFAVVRPGHHASIKVLEKCNLQLCGELDDVKDAEKSLVYKLEK